MRKKGIDPKEQNKETDQPEDTSSVDVLEENADPFQVSTITSSLHHFGSSKALFSSLFRLTYLGHRSKEGTVIYSREGPGSWLTR